MLYKFLYLVQNTHNTTLLTILLRISDKKTYIGPSLNTTNTQGRSFPIVIVWSIWIKFILFLNSYKKKYFWWYNK